jgi:hypothetical protein
MVLEFRIDVESPQSGLRGRNLKWVFAICTTCLIASSPACWRTMPSVRYSTSPARLQVVGSKRKRRPNYEESASVS